MQKFYVRAERKAAGDIFQMGAAQVNRQAVLSNLKESFAHQSLRSGLRSAQRGAVAAIQAHWTVSKEPALVVMPTGSGKTETMLTLFAEGFLDRLIVIVPWTPLRDQTLKKFLELGLLKELRILPEDATTPVVAVGKHRFKTPNEVSDLVDDCNVLVINIQSLTGSSPEAMQALAQKFSHVFIDEAHHLAAPSWTAVQNCFLSIPTVLFTATPFRRDGKRVDAKTIYNFPLRLAQQEGFFQPITFRPVYQFSREKADRAIAATALDQLRSDLKAGLDHILLVRAELVDRANDLQAIYESLAPDLKPVAIHSHNKGLRKKHEDQLKSRTSRILVCVDMFGEGFDFPQLKVAALHDLHRSLAITLQFLGRFTRPGEGVGSATVVANLGDVKVEDALRELYAEDADWNALISLLSSEATGRVKRRSDLLSSFAPLPNVSIQNLFPKMSATFFKTRCPDWEPLKLELAWTSDELYWGPSISAEHATALAVVRIEEPIPWGDLKELRNTQWHLFAFHWNKSQQLLYVYSSDKESLHEELAKLVCGDNVEIVKGEDVYRSLHGINRIIVTNLGLKNHTGNSVSHEMLTGPDVGDTVSPQKLQKRTKTNLFGRGYDSEGSTSRGCSTKGRIWCHKVADDVSDWIDWCRSVGDKVLDETISGTSFLQGVMKTKKVTERPALVPLAIDWPLSLWKNSAEPSSVAFNGTRLPFYECELVLVDHSKTGDIQFDVVSERQSFRFKLTFGVAGVSTTKMGKGDVDLEFRRRKEALGDYFQNHPPTVYFENEAVLEEGLLCQPDVGLSPYERSKISAWDWGTTDLRKESMGRTRETDSIQKYVLDKVESEWEVVFNDDEKGEIADLVALRRDGDLLRVRLIHCKWAIDGKPGIRLKDLYEVCGQAQKSVRWRDRWEKFFSHLASREAIWEALGLSRIERGDKKLFLEIQNQARLLRPHFEVWIVQPGISVKDIKTEHLHLLASTENYLSDAGQVPLVVVGSP